MVETPDNIILEHLRRFDRHLSDFDAKLDRALDGLHTVKVRLTAVEENLVGVQGASTGSRREPSVSSGGWSSPMRRIEEKA